VTAGSLSLLLVGVIIIAIPVSYFTGRYRQAHRHELKLKRLRNRSERTGRRHQEKIRQTEDRIRRDNG
jgi:uncharacterized protein HemX